MTSHQSKQGRSGAAKDKTSAKAPKKLEKSPMNGKAKAKGPGKEESMKDAAKDAKKEDLDESNCGRIEDEETVDETTAPKMISVHEAKQITRRILRRIKKENK